MPIVQADDGVRNAMLDGVESHIGVSPTLEIRAGTMPASCATADSGSLLGTMNLPSDWMQNAALGQKLKSGDFKFDSAVGAGTATYWRLRDGSNNCKLQGDVTGLAGDGSMKLQNVSVTIGQAVILSSFTMVASNA